MQYFDITVPANGAFPVNARGTFLYYLAGSAGGADPTLRVRNGFGATTVLLKPGQSIRIPPAELRSDTWTLENFAGAATILGTVLVGEGDFSDNRISGTVQVIDVTRQQTVSNMAFMGYVSSGAQAASNSQMMVFNPPGSGKNVYIDRIQTNSGNANDSLMMSFATSTAGCTDKGTLTSKLAGGAASQAHQYTALAGALPGGLFGYVNAGAEWKPSRPIALAPGNGLLMTSSYQNNGIGWVIETVEDV